MTLEFLIPELEFFPDPFEFVLPVHRPGIILDPPVNLYKRMSPRIEMHADNNIFERSIQQIESELFDIGLQIPSQPELYENFLKFNLNMISNDEILDPHYMNMDAAVGYRHKRELERMKTQLHACQLPPVVDSKAYEIDISHLFVEHSVKSDVYDPFDLD